MSSAFTRTFGHTASFEVNSAFEEGAGILPSTADLAPSAVASVMSIERAASD